MATAPSDNGEYALRCYGSPNRVQPQPQAAEIEPPSGRLPEAEDSSSHWHNVTAPRPPLRPKALGPGELSALFPGARGENLGYIDDFNALWRYTMVRYFSKYNPATRG
jgi:hypothetical protein